mmetsp:Transcript_6006/g.18447  ORF Transcript_6006/g.18447 Transcript_6006/m.18447 type:complete len:209 (+) Transcript_6006:125-751(+)|eukprot:scaffold21103_cov36-Tisochrysis_lutea.AAC.2
MSRPANGRKHDPPMLPLNHKSSLDLAPRWHHTPWPPWIRHCEPQRRPRLACHTESAHGGPTACRVVSEEGHPDVFNGCCGQAGGVHVSFVHEYPLALLDGLSIDVAHEGGVRGIVETDAIVQYNEVVGQGDSQRFHGNVEPQISVMRRAQARRAQPRVTITESIDGADVAQTTTPGGISSAPPPLRRTIASVTTAYLARRNLFRARLK